MKVLIILEYDEIAANSKEADVIVNDISQSCDEMQVVFDANGCYIQEVFDEDDFILQQSGKMAL